MPVSELAGRLVMDRTTCTREVAPLVGAGLVEIAAGSDRRRRLPQPTSLGERNRSQAHQAWKQVQRAVADEYGDAGVHALLADLGRLLAGSEQPNSV